MPKSIRISKTSGTAQEEAPPGYSKEGEAPFSGVVLFACLFRLLFASTAWVGWMAVWFALLSAFYRFGVKGLFDVLMWVGLACCGVAIASGVFAWVLTRSEAWKDEKEELYRAVDKSSK